MTDPQTLDVELNVAASRLWKAFCDLNNLGLRLMPTAFTSIKWIQGDGGPGSIREVKYAPGPDGEAGSLNYLMDVVDHDKYIFSYRITKLEGKTGFSPCRVTGHIVPAPTAPGKCVLKYAFEYEEAGHEPHKNFYPAFLKMLEAHLVANEAEYA